ncbi:MAG: T9SS type A sorting domain-containing protein [Chitinophagaceae bacterium]
MKFNFYILLFCLALIGFTSYSQAPNQPVTPVPAHEGGTGSINPDLCATVSDPNGGTLRVKYSGRAKTTNGSEKFTIVLLPDTQYYTEEPQGNHGGNTAMFNAQTTWIANNRQSMNIVYVGQLGDCVQNGDNPPSSNKEIEWQRAQTAIATIESEAQTGLPQGIPFGICVGNHEQTPFGDATGTTIYYNQYFGSSHFTGRDYYGGHYGSNNDNHYQVFSASGIDFLIISLEFDQSATFAAPGGPLDWAEELVQNNPDRKVIVMTHWVINESASFGPQGQAIYDRLKTYPNFSFLMGGHVSSATGGEAKRTDIHNGNRVHSILTDYQSRLGGGNGLLRIYEFDPSLNKVSVKTYSPYTNMYETDANSQFELSFNMLPLIGQMNNVQSGTAPCYSWTDLLSSTDYEWGMELYDGQNVTIGPLWSFTTPAEGSLPVTVVDFFARIENKKVRLSWKTASEFNNERFEIERSKDGGSFSKVGEIAGKGNSTVLQQYTFYDEQPISGQAFYRLKQVDIDGRFEYSNIQSVLSEDQRSVVFYPNPVYGSDIININLNKPVSRQMKILIHDMSGRELFSESKNNVQNNIQIKPKLSPGIYIVQIISETLIATEKIMVIR